MIFKKTAQATLLFFLATLVFSTPSLATDSAFENLDQIISRLQLSSYYQLSQKPQPIRIAILDMGFAGYQKELGKSLPANTFYHAGPLAAPTAEPEEDHGKYMAELVTAVITNNGRSHKIPFELHLYPTSGHTNFVAATQDVIQRKIDIVLYAQIWDFGGNDDGKGFINAAVNPVTAAGVLWINAAGDFSNMTFRAPIKRGVDDWAVLPGPNSSVQIRCRAAEGEKCPVRLVLAWNDFKNNTKDGTDKDLDLILTDDTLRIVQAAELTQKREMTANEPGSSLYPREIIQAELDPGLYYARVKIRSKNFKSRDQLRITAVGKAIEMINKTDEDTVFNPADNKTVLTIGASDLPLSSKSKRLHKPELLFESNIQIADKEEGLAGGTSFAAAIAAGVTGILKAYLPDLTREDLIKDLAQSSSRFNSEAGTGLPLSLLQFAPTGDGCFQPAQLMNAPATLQPLLRDGGYPVMSTAGIKIFINQDPIQVIRGLIRLRPDDMVVGGAVGYNLYPRWQQANLPFGAYEVVQVPQGQYICADAGNSGEDVGLPTKAVQMPAPSALGLR